MIEVEAIEKREEAVSPIGEEAAAAEILGLARVVGS